MNRVGKACARGIRLASPRAGGILVCVPTAHIHAPMARFWMMRVQAHRDIHCAGVFQSCVLLTDMRERVRWPERYGEAVILRRSR